MNETRDLLRNLFVSKTDIELSKDYTSWQEYAQWLETLHTRSINNTIIKKNNHLSNAIHSVIDILDKAITNPLKD